MVMWFMPKTDCGVDQAILAVQISKTFTFLLNIHTVFALDISEALVRLQSYWM
jgi:hypothetical protein